MKPVKLAELEARIPDIGRIRAGHQVQKQRKDGKGTYMASVQTLNWILSAQTTDNLEILQAVPEIGGTIEAWPDPNTTDRFRLYTETEQLHVVLPPGALSEPSYQRWGGGRLIRRCDGETCQAWPKDMAETIKAWEQKFPGKPPPNPRDTSVTIPCVCHDLDDERLQCQPKQHLGVLLPQVTIGQWRLVTSSMNALRELKASVEIVRLASAVNLPRAILTRVDRVSGEKQFRVPIVTTAATFDQIQAAAEALGALPGGGVAGTPVAIAAGTVPPMAIPAGAVTAPIEPEFGGEVDEMAPAEMAPPSNVVELHPPDADPSGDMMDELGVAPGDPHPGMSEAEAEEARALMESMRSTSPKPVKKGAKKAAKKAGKKAAKKGTTKKAGKRSAAQSAVPSADGDRQLVREAYLALGPPDSEALEAVLAQADLWPIDSIPDDRAEEAALLAEPVVKAAQRAGRV